MFPQHLLLSSLLWFLDVSVIVVVAAILEDEYVNLLEVDVAHMEADKVPLRKDPGNAGTVDAVITSPRNVGRNLVDLSGRSFLSLDSSAPRNTPHDYSSTSSILPGSFTVVLTQEEYDRLRQLSSLITIFQQLMHLL